LFSKQTFAVAVVCAGAVHAFPVHAQTNTDGNISAYGQVTGDACTPKVNGGGADGTIMLPSVGISQFPSGGDTAGWTPFRIEIHCSTALDANVWVYFSQGSADAVTGRLKNTGTAQGIDLQLTDGEEAPFKVWGDPATRAGGFVHTSENFPVLHYGVQYYRDETATRVLPGSVVATVRYSLQYD